jgi:hypothetical protein
MQPLQLESKQTEISSSESGVEAECAKVLRDMYSKPAVFSRRCYSPVRRVEIKKIESEKCEKLFLCCLL